MQRIRRDEPEKERTKKIKAKNPITRHQHNRAKRSVVLDIQTLVLSCYCCSFMLSVLLAMRRKTKEKKKGEKSRVGVNTKKSFHGSLFRFCQVCPSDTLLSMFFGENPKIMSHRCLNIIQNH